MCVKAQKRRTGAKVGEEAACSTGVFSGNDRHARQDLGGPGGEVAEIAEWSGDDVEGAGWGHEALIEEAEGNRRRRRVDSKTPQGCGSGVHRHQTKERSP